MLALDADATTEYEVHTTPHIVLVLVMCYLLLLLNPLVVYDEQGQKHISPTKREIGDGGDGVVITLL